MKLVTKITILLIAGTMVSSCADFLDEVKPETSQNVESLRTSATDLDVCINGAYGALWSPAGMGTFQTVSEYNSDLYYAYPKNKSKWITNRDGDAYRRYYAGRDYNNQAYVWQWGNLAINMANTVVESIDKGMADNDPNIETHRDRLKGEGLLVRAIAYWNITLLSGQQYHETTLNTEAAVYRDWPIISPSDIDAPLRTVGEMYNFIVEDLKNAVQLLPENYDENIHPIAYLPRMRKDAAKGYLAKVYFQMNKQDEALALCNEILGPVSESGSVNYPLNDNFNDIYQRVGNYDYSPNKGLEIIYAAEGSSAQKWTQANKWGFYRDTRPSGSSTRKYLAMGQPFKDLWDQANDRRFKEMIEIDAEGYWWQKKFSVEKINVPILRASEFHLMRAEINARKDYLSQALIDLNVVRTRAGLEPFQSTNKDAIIQEIIDERTREMFCEWNRFWDLKRLGALTGSKIPLGQRDGEDKVYVGGVDELPWDSYLLKYDIPSNEYQYNPGL
jgi:hypothetical protein